MFDRLHHIAILCSDYPKSKHATLTFLVFKITARFIVKNEDPSSSIRRWEIDINSNYFLFLIPARPSSPEACGLRHVAFEVDDVQETAQRLRDRGVDVGAIRVGEATNKSFTFFRDPDDLPMEIYEQ